MRNNNTKMLAASAILSALAVILLFIGSIIDILDITCAAAASLAVALAREELNGKYAVLVYIVSSVLSLLLVPSSACAIYYAVFLGYYPIVAERFFALPRILRILTKLILFNTAIALTFLFARWVFLDAGTEASAVVLSLVCLLTNIFFAAYDTALNRLKTAYRRHFRSVWNIDRFFNKPKV